MDYVIRRADCPRRVKSYTVYNRAEDFYIIVIDARLDRRQAVAAYWHEMRHIKGGDFSADLTAESVERKAHSAERGKNGKA